MPFYAEGLIGVSYYARASVRHYSYSIPIEHWPMKCALFIDRRGGLLKCSKKWPIDCFDIKKKDFFPFITAG